jgi:formiminotetrahydrofolate cyclodeaminase
MKVGELLDRLGSSDPAPGGGAAAALAGALGAALLQMTANLTIGRPKLVDVEEQARRLGARAGILRLRLAQLGDADAQAFEQVSAAYRLPRENDAQKAARSAAIQAALHTATAVPVETAQLCAEVLELAEGGAPILNSSVISDVLVGALLARAALEGAALNIDINLATLTDAAAIERYAADLERARLGTTERLQRVLEAGRARFPRPSRKT